MIEAIAVAIVSAVAGRAVGVFGKVAAWVHAGTPDQPLSFTFSVDPSDAPPEGVFAFGDTHELESATTEQDFVRAFSRSPGGYAAGSPHSLVIWRSANRARNDTVLIKDVELTLQDYAPLASFDDGVTFVQATSIQAGGRGSEGHFSLSFNGTKPLNVPLNYSASARALVQPHWLKLAAGQLCGITVRIFPKEEGRYSFRVFVVGTQEGRDFRMAVGSMSVVQATSVNWCSSFIRSFNWMAPITRTPGPPTLDWQTVRAHASYEKPPEGARVLVTGEMSDVPF